jgi:hypothetical protein
MTDIETKEAIDEIREALQTGKEWYEQGHEDLGENNNGDMTFDNALDSLDQLEASIKQPEMVQHCLGCAGGKNIPCHDPQCGDSTWDHECTAGWKACPGISINDKGEGK